jgi:hypothetical protein
MLKFDSFFTDYLLRSTETKPEGGSFVLFPKYLLRSTKTEASMSKAQNEKGGLVKAQRRNLNVEVYRLFPIAFSGVQRQKPSFENFMYR